MSTIGTLYTLADWAKQIDPNGAPAKLANVMEQSNPILEDMIWQEGNLPTGHRSSIVTGIPAPTWRKLNYGVAQSKDTEQQVDDTCGLLEAWSEVDCKIAELNGNTAAFRLQRDTQHIEGMNQAFATALFYADTASDPEKFLGLAPRYYDLLATTSYGNNNVLNAGGSGSDLSSIWLVGWGPSTVFGIFPKGSKAGLSQEDKGKQTKVDSSGRLYDVYRSKFVMEAGLVVANWKYIVRIANVETAISASGATTNGLTTVNLLVWAMNKIPNLNMCKPVFYCNGNVKTQFDILAMTKSNAFYMKDDPFGRSVTMFNGVPVKKCDAILNTESALS